MIAPLPISRAETAFRYVLPEEASALAPLLATAPQGRTWNAADIARLQPPQGFVLADPARCLGVALVSLAADEAELLDIGIAPEARGRGHGRALLAACEARAAALGARRMLLEVAVDNASARALYTAAGYAKIGHRPAYYVRETVRIDALVLAHDLTAGLTQSSAQDLGQAAPSRAIVRPVADDQTRR
ncbi:MAG: GNAT family N-acetyltransferase [Pseudomonadota bacterium]